jgi:hypothetical protein
MTDDADTTADAGGADEISNLQLTLELASPVAMGHPWINGDGLVRYLAIVDEFGRDFLELRAREEEEEPLDLDPVINHGLVETDGIGHASISFFDSDETRQESIYGRYDEMFAHLVRGSGRPRSKIPLNGGEFKSQVIELTVQPATRCVFFFRGNERRLRDLFDRHFTGLGKKRSCGYGQVTDYEWTRLDEDRSVVAGGQAMRPIPVDRCEFVTEIENLAWRAPYHYEGNHTRCAAPGADVRVSGL